MKTSSTLLFILAFFFLGFNLSAQNFTQTIRGTILDVDAQIPLIGANVLIANTDPLLGTSTDLDGKFKIENVPVGRHTIQVSYLGYEPQSLNSILVNSGKELVLNIELQESMNQLAEVIVKASDQQDISKALNEFATVSARTFSVEETARYAFSAFDPSRMAQNYAGVSIGATDDLSNEIVIRGNSPTGVLWRMEGIEVTNPNHFSSMGSSGGGISMLSSSTLSNSDFYTGAFPSEFGNALSGVFDLNLRKGNNEKREFSFMLGALGIEASTEGPIGEKGKASYLFNYRYSTLGLLNEIGLNPVGDILPSYQDLSFKINIPTEKAGTFSLFGLGGTNLAEFIPEQDSVKWISEYDAEGFKEPQKIGMVGLSHRILLSQKSYLHSTFLASYENTKEDVYSLDATDNYKQKLFYKDNIGQTAYRFRTSYNLKINNKNTFQVGAIIGQKDFVFKAEELNEENNKLETIFDNNGSTATLQSFAQWKHRFTEELTLNAGAHYTLMGLNNKMVLEPRAALAWQMNKSHRFGLSAGFHSKMEPLALYLFEGSFPDGTKIEHKKHLGFTKAFHGVVSYDYAIAPKLRFKSEIYYQHIYNVPIENKTGSKQSILNALDVWDLIDLENAVADGKGNNYGIDLTLEKFFADQYYFMATGSLFESNYTAIDGKTYGTRFNGNYQANVLGGKEFSVGKKGNKTLGVNTKFILSGGNRYTPVDFEASKIAGYEIRKTDQPFAARTPAYARIDLGLSYRINTNSLTHTIMLDFQNLTNRQNTYAQFYNSETEKLESYTLTGFFPNFNYRIEF